MQHDPWATATVVGTIPVAMLIGIYMRGIRPGRVLEGTMIGIALLIACVVGGFWVDQSETMRSMFDWDGRTCAWFVMIYGFAAATLPVWLLLAPRDYLSTFLKLGVVFMLAVAIVVLAPEVKMPAMTEFARTGMGPIFKGDLFPFVFITIACGAISGFHSLVSSGTTPKLLANEREIRMIGYGSMALESFVAIMAVIAATVLDPGVYFAINIDLGKTGEETVAVISSWGPQYAVTIEQMKALAVEMGLPSLFARTGGAPSLAVGMASIFSETFGGGLMKFWYHFAIMFEVLFILTTLDAGTRVGRFMFQDLGKHFWKPFGNVSSYPMTVIASFIFVAAWGYFLWQGVTDPKGGIRFLWPLFGISNQLLAGIALTVATGIIIKMGKLKFAWVTGVPLTWLAVVCTTAAITKVFSPNPEIGFWSGANALAARIAEGTIPAEKVGEAWSQVIAFRIDAALALFFAIVLWVVIADMLRMSLRMRAGRSVLPLSESQYVKTQLVPGMVGAGSHI
jgi:carbon starvation protein